MVLSSFQVKYECTLRDVLLGQICKCRRAKRTFEIAMESKGPNAEGTYECSPHEADLGVGSLHELGLAIGAQVHVL